MSDVFDGPNGEKTLHSYHLVTIKTAVCVQIFAASGVGSVSGVCAFCE
jgi:hypothetical protein